MFLYSIYASLQIYHIIIIETLSFYYWYSEKKRDRNKVEKSEKDKTEEEKAQDMIKKAKVEDDEYKTEEQTYYRY